MTAWIIETLIATTLLMGLVLLVRERVAAFFGARVAYLLWLLPAIRMILPPLPEAAGPAPIQHLPGIMDFSVLQVVGTVADTVPMAVESSISWSIVALTIWLAGAITYFGWQLFAYRRFVAFALTDATDLPEMDRHGIEVCASKAVDGPFATGIFVQRIVLPHDYRRRYSEAELRLAMQHEIAHHRRGDLSVNYLALTILSLHWFNPVAWKAWRAFRADQELACDAIVLTNATQQDRHSYGLALFKSACDRTPAVACSLNPRDQLKKRLRMMCARSNHTVSGHVLALVMVSGGLGLTVSGGVCAETTRKVEHQVRSVVAEKVQSADQIASIIVGESAAAPISATSKVAVAWAEPGMSEIHDRANPQPQPNPHPNSQPNPQPYEVETPQPPVPPAPPVAGSVVIARGNPTAIMISTTGPFPAKGQCTGDNDVVQISVSVSTEQGNTGGKTANITRNATVCSKVHSIKVARMSALAQLRAVRAQVLSLSTFSDAQRREIASDMDREIRKLSTESES